MRAVVQLLKSAPIEAAEFCDKHQKEFDQIQNGNILIVMADVNIF